MNDYQEKIKNARKERGLNRDDFAKILGVSSGAVGMWESGKNPPSIATMTLISRDKSKSVWVRKLFAELLDGALVAAFE